MKLSPDEMDDLETTLLSDGWAVVLKLVNALTVDQEKNVLNYSLEAGSEGLIQAKCRYEGARKLNRSIQDMKKVYLKEQG